MDEFSVGVRGSGLAVGYGRLWVETHTIDQVEKFKARAESDDEWLPHDAFPKPFADFVAKAGRGVTAALASYFRVGVDEMAVKTRADRRAAERRFRKRMRKVHRDWTPRVMVCAARVQGSKACIEVEVLEGRHEGARLRHVLSAEESEWVRATNKVADLKGCEVRVYLLSRRSGASVFPSGVYEMVRMAGGPTPRRVEFLDRGVAGVARDPFARGDR